MSDETIKTYCARLYQNFNRTPKSSRNREWNRDFSLRERMRGVCTVPSCEGVIVMRFETTKTGLISSYEPCTAANHPFMDMGTLARVKLIAHRDKVNRLIPKPPTMKPERKTKCDNYRCVDCEKNYEAIEVSSLYECSGCGTEFSREESYDGMSHTCPDCHKWGTISNPELVCPDCHEEVEEVDDQ